MFPAWHLPTPPFTATLSLYGGQLLGYTPHGGQPLFYLSPTALLQPGKAIRGGVPLCWPWFGKHASDTSQPQHGVARTALWTVNAIARSELGFHVKLNGPAPRRAVVQPEPGTG